MCAPCPADLVPPRHHARLPSRSFPKAHGGGGGYLLGRNESAEACRRPACLPSGDVPTDARGAAASAGASDLVPPGGWGRGVGRSAVWMARSSLQFNGAAMDVFSSPRLRAGESV